MCRTPMAPTVSFPALSSTATMLPLAPSCEPTDLLSSPVRLAYSDKMTVNFGLTQYVQCVNDVPPGSDFYGCNSFDLGSAHRRSY